VTQIKTRSDAVKVMTEQGCSFRNGHHLVGYNERGACPLPHREELCAGTRHAIIRTLLRMGLTVAVLTFGALVVLRLLTG
jgi:hypothetical protein